jgi:CRP-like cAMP-binding protein
MRPRPVAAGESVIQQGDAADRFYVIADGRFLVTQRDAAAAPGEPARVLREMGPDEVFGEIGLLRHSARTASVAAVTDGLLLELDGARFLEFVGSSSGLGARLLDLHRGSHAVEGHPAEVSAG